MEEPDCTSASKITIIDPLNLCALLTLNTFSNKTLETKASR